MSSLTQLANKCLSAWDATAVKGQRTPVLHEMQGVMRMHKDVKSAEAHVMDMHSQSLG